MRKTLAALLAMFGSACAAGGPPPSTPAQASVSLPASARRCFILREIGKTTPPVREGDACGARFTPASTFKVPHAMIALETGARSGPEDLERWDGQKHDIAVWNQDQTLASAIEHSAVWYFQRTAVKIGRARMTEYLAKLHYGNQLVGDEITTFWLEGPLAISADEQADFMGRLVERTLPLRTEVMEAVDRMLLQRPGTFVRAVPIELDVTWDPAETRVFGKTGSIEHGGDNIRWLVGHLTSRDRRYVFVSLVVAKTELSTEAVTQAMHELRDRGLLRARPAAR